MSTINIKQAVDLVATIGSEVTVVVQGEMGTGKSSILSMLAERFKDTHDARYIDATILDLGDIQMPSVSADGVEFIPNKLFMGSNANGVERPLIVMIDELGKAMRPVQNALLPLLLEKRVGSHHLPAGSIVFATTNLSSDGVGDQVQAHARNRVCFVEMSKPTAEEWVAWAGDNDIAPELMAWASEFPHAFASYRDVGAGDDNPYIFNPRKQAAAFVTPRSMAKASPIVKNRGVLGPDVTISALAGCVGESAARDMQAFLSLSDALPSWKAIINNPETAPLPESSPAACILAMSAVVRLDESNIKDWLTYLVRLSKEVQALWISQIMRGGKAAMVARNKEFTKLCVTNAWMY